MKYTTTAYPFTHKEFVEAFKANPENWNNEKPDWGLRPKDQHALEVAMDLLLDLTIAAEDAGDDDGPLFGNLPSVYAHRYDATFRKRFLDNFKNLRQRIMSGEHFELRSVADELAFYTIDQWAREELEEQGEPTDELGGLFESLYQDTDFLLLSDLRSDGIQDDEEMTKLFGFAHLKFDEWFEWFDNVS